MAKGPRAELIERRATEDLWRTTRYQRRDGSTFEVTVPPIRDTDYGLHYDEASEAEMLLRLTPPRDAD